MRELLTTLLGAILFGGVLGPVALMVGLTYTSASTASLLLNLEAVDRLDPRLHPLLDGAPLAAVIAVDARWQELMRVRYELPLPDAAGTVAALALPINRSGCQSFG